MRFVHNVAETNSSFPTHKLFSFDPKGTLLQIRFGHLLTSFRFELIILCDGLYFVMDTTLFRVDLNTEIAKSNYFSDEPSARYFAHQPLVQQRHTSHSTNVILAKVWHVFLISVPYL